MILRRLRAVFVNFKEIILVESVVYMARKLASIPKRIFEIRARIKKIPEWLELKQV